MAKPILEDKEILYDLQFKQKIYYRYFPFTAEGLFLLGFVSLLPLNLMESGGLYVVLGLIVYRTFTSRREFEVEHIFVFASIIAFISWVANREREKK